LEVRDFPVIVAIDAFSSDLFQEGPLKYQR